MQFYMQICRASDHYRSLPEHIISCQTGVIGTRFPATGCHAFPLHIKHVLIIHNFAGQQSVCWALLIVLDEGVGINVAMWPTEADARVSR